MAFFPENSTELDNVVFGALSAVIIDVPVEPTLPTEVPSVQEYIARLNGDTQCWYLSTPIAVDPTTTIKFKFKPDSNTVSSGFKRFIGSENYSLSLTAGNDPTEFRFVGCTAELDGVPIVSDFTKIPTDNEEHLVTLTPTVSTDIEAFGGLKNRDDRNIGAALYDLEFNDTNVIPLKDKDQGATQSPTTGSVSATMVNYTDVWELYE